MDSEEEIFFNQIISLDRGYSDTDCLEEMEDVKEKENNKNVTKAQRKKLVSFMNGRTGFTKGKMKHTEKSQKFLDEWTDLTSKLNTMGPPCHSSSKMKLSQSSSVIRGRDDTHRS